MKIVRSLAEIPPLPAPCGLTIGSFDGVHLGHQILLKHLRALVGKEGTVALLTFSNHPAQILQNRPPVPLIYPLDQKLHLLKENGVDLVILLEFTEEFAAQSYEIFLRAVHARFPFDYLVLGEGAKLGHKGEGDEHKVKILSDKIGFTAEYLPKLKIGTEIVSSGRIRILLKEGNLDAASRLLGRAL